MMADYWQQHLATNDGGGGAAAAAAATVATADDSCNGVGIGIDIAVNSNTTTTATSNNNNNYVNFNQFIMQHNLGGATAATQPPPQATTTTAVPTTATTTTPTTLSNMQEQPTNNYHHMGGSGNGGGGGGGAFGLTPNLQQQQRNHHHHHHPDETSNNFNAFFANIQAQQYFQYHHQNGNGFSGSGAGDNLHNPTSYSTSNSSYSNLYSPFNGQNPFASGGFEISASKLQPDAPEFVPSFAKLNINKDATTAAPPAAHSSSSSSLQSATTNGTAKLANGIVTANCNLSATETAEPSTTTSTTTTTTNGQSTQSQQQPPRGATSKLSHQHYRAANNFTPTERERENKQGVGQGGSSSNSGRQRRTHSDYREDRDDRYDRNDRNDRKKPQKQQRYDNHRSNKRRDDWNRNRDRITGYRAEELDTSNESPLPSPEKKPQQQQQAQQPSPKRPQENEKLSQREKLIRDIEQRRLECLVCVEQIKAHHGVWSCQNCYTVLHLKCTTTWATSSKDDNGWRCPACQNVRQEVPREYFCFCGKIKNPQLSRTELAHSCGETCCRIEGCSHACVLLCHPGPCPQCTASVTRSCGCGKTTRMLQCAMKENIECGAVCGKPLNCEQHKCEALCHAGKCEPCGQQIEQNCHCGKQNREVACTRDTQDRRNYSCSKPCARPLLCGNHKCKDSCHAGACRPCKLSPEQVTSCPCGKLPVMVGERTSCLDAVPTCEGTCSKTLRCGKPAHPHQCASKCHLGQCPPCNKQTAVKCRCGHMDQMIKCRQLSTRADDARCKKRCTKKRSCGKHKCAQECCIDIDHACTLPCNRTLSCGKHRCDQPCHRGNCPPCYRSSFDELYCECGAEVYYPPVPCGTKRPKCTRACSRTHPCEHPPQHNCHSSASCPPCMILTTKWCYGQHEQRKTIPCSQASFSCGLACNRPLPCGRHKCIKPCHEGACQQPPPAGAATAAAGSSSSSEQCRQSCPTLRPSCGHKCAAPCHDGNCPETPCKELVEVQCECGNRKQNRSCHELAREFSRIATAQLASSMAEMSRGNYMELSEILAPVKLNNKTNRTLDCNDDCRVVERNRRLAIGLQIRNPDTQQKLLTKYSEFVRGFAKRNPVLTKSVYEKLTDLVKLAKESKQKSRSHSFATMNREKRQFVHELCEMFGVDSVSYDKEPNRNVVATAHKDRSWLPATSIMEVLARESGQRRVPVPSNNAWSLKK